MWKQAYRADSAASNRRQHCQHPLNRVKSVKVNTFNTSTILPTSAIWSTSPLHPNNLHAPSVQVVRSPLHNRAQTNLSRSNPRRDTLQNTQPRQQLKLNRVNLGSHCGGIREQQDQGKDIGPPPKKAIRTRGMTLGTESRRFPLLESFFRFALFLKSDISQMRKSIDNVRISLIINANGFAH